MIQNRADGGYDIVAIVSSFGGGDRPPVLALAVGLRDRGHRVSVLCDGDVADLVRPSGLPMIQLPRQLELFTHIDANSLLRMAQRGEDITVETPNPLANWARACLATASKAIEPLKPHILISTLLCPSLAALLATELNIPWIFVNPGAYFGEDAKRPWNADFGGLTAGLVRHWVFPELQRANAIIHATDAEFDPPPASMPAHHRYVGPLLDEETGAIPEFLMEPGHPWVLISLSTLPQTGELAIARAALDALKDRPVRILLTLSRDHPIGELGALPANARVTGFMPHGPVLERACLVVAHAGHGTVMRALWYGVPMVLVPWGRDQPGVAARAESMGAAMVVPRPECTSSNLANAISRVLSEPRYTEAARYASSRLQAHDSVAEGCAYIEGVLQHCTRRTLTPGRQLRVGKPRGDRDGRQG
jgi:UDP:flavonoid glycosyltransferase YjiC (YdhE family)